MATRRWQGNAAVVPQVSTVQITADDAATTYTITINGIAVSVAGAGTGVNDTASALQAALAASTHPYFTDVTWTVATDTVTGTGNSSGYPFTATSSVNGGTGTIGAVTVATTAESPNHFNLADNWSGNTVPVSTDEIIIAGNTPSILFDLDQSAVAPAELHVLQSYTGFIGHNPLAYTIPGGAAAVAEYRDTHLQIDCDRIYIGQKLGGGSQLGSGRLNINNASSGTPRCYVYNTRTTPQDTDSVCLDYVVSDAQAELYIQSAPGGVGVAAKVPGTTAQLATISMDAGVSSKLFTGPGLTLSELVVRGGDAIVNLAADLATFRQFGGQVTFAGDGYEVTDADIFGGTCIPLHTDGTRVFGTCDIWAGGFVDFTQNKEDRTVTTITLRDGGAFRFDANLTTGLAIAAEEGTLRFDR